MSEAGAPPAGGRRFATTRWSLVLAAGQDAAAGSAEALARLCEIYWYPVYAFVRHQGYSSDDAADLTQAFFTRVLERHYFAGADPGRGRFRAFLCAAVRHFLSNERDWARALKRGGAHQIVPFEAVTAEGRYRREPRDEVTPETLFDRRWALLVLERALERLREEHRAAGKIELFERLKGFLTGDHGDQPYAEAAEHLSMTEGALRVAVHRLRRRFRDALTSEIAETVSDPADAAAELDHLMRAVSS
jgi:RNA polymerase sigma-70 factor (ECF subfamily)